MKAKPPMRWSIDYASTETKIHPRTIKQKLSGLKVLPGADGKYGTAEIMGACYGTSPLEQEAKEAKFRQQIDEAEIVKIQRELQESSSVKRPDYRDQLADLFTKQRQIVELWPIKESMKKEFLSQQGSIQLERKIIPIK